MSIWMNGDYYISTDKSLIDKEKVHRFLSNDSYWAENIPYKAVAASIENSMCFGIYAVKNNELVGFARVISDFVRFAYLADVFVLPAYRGLGLSKWLVMTIVACPEFEGVRFCLVTKDAHTLYEQYGGFKALEDNNSWMVINSNLEKTIKKFSI